MMVITWTIKKWRAQFRRGEEIVEKVGHVQQHSVSANKDKRTLSFYVKKCHKYKTNYINIFIFYKIFTYFTPNFSFQKHCYQFFSCSVKVYVRLYIRRIFKLILVIYLQFSVVSYIKAWSSRHSLCLRLSWLNCSPNMFVYSTMLCTLNKPYFCNNISLRPSRIVTCRIFIASSNTWV